MGILLLKEYTCWTWRRKLEVVMSNVVRLLLIAVAFLLPSSAMAQTFSCHPHNGAPYCFYSGKLSRVYVNEGNLMLFYMEEAIDANLPSSVGISGVSQLTSVAYPASNNPVFAEYLYSTALTAYAGNKTVSMQFRRVYGGWLIVDRIWIQ